MRRPRGQHHQLLPGLPRHYPHCTKRRRGEEGCECSIYYYSDSFPKPNARTYRRTRRCVRRAWRRWDLMEKRHGWPPPHPVPLRDWPQPVTSWKGLTR